MDGEIQLDLSTFRAMVRATLGWRLWFYRAIGLLLVALGVAAFASGVSAVSSVFEVLVGLLIGASDEWSTRLGWRRLRGLTGRPWRYRIADEGIGIHTPATDVELRWEAVVTAARARTAWVLKTTTRQRLAIPRAAFSAADAAWIDQKLPSG